MIKACIESVKHRKSVVANLLKAVDGFGFWTYLCEPMAPQMLATMLVAVSWSAVSGQLRGMSATNETNATDQKTLRSASGSVSGHPDPSKTYPSYPGFTLALVEEFDSPLDLDSDPIWTWSDGGLFEGDVRFVKQQIRFEDGKMKITATQNPGYSTSLLARRGGDR